MQALWYGISTCTLCFIVEPLQCLAGMAAEVKNASKHDITDQPTTPQGRSTEH